MSAFCPPKKWFLRPSAPLMRELHDSFRDAERFPRKPCFSSSLSPPQLRLTAHACILAMLVALADGLQWTSRASTSVAWAQLPHLGGRAVPRTSDSVRVSMSAMSRRSAPLRPTPILKANMCIMSSEIINPSNLDWALFSLDPSFYIMPVHYSKQQRRHYACSRHLR
jgi:hypothetical protein